MAIPVQNIYYLLCYAWDEFAPRQMERVGSEDFPDTMHLFARLLAVGARLLHQRGLETEYVTFEHATSSPRGRIFMSDTLRLTATQPNRAWCGQDEMNANVLTNQILRATLGRMVEAAGLKPELRAEVRQTWRLFEQIQDIELTRREFYKVRLHQNNRLYAFLINVCRFLFDSLQPLDHAGGYKFQDVLREPERLRRVYEKFVRNFYKRSQDLYAVRRDRMSWVGSSIDGAEFARVPQMETDVTLRSKSRTIVVECKYVESMYQQNFLTEKFRSGHLYQLVTYLRNLGDDSEGILLYPTAGIEVDQCYILQEHRVRVTTLNLDRPWPDIAAGLLTLVAAPQSVAQ